MAAFCACCGQEIGERDEACRICGTPRHGMMRPDGLTLLHPGDEGESDEIHGSDEGGSQF